MCGSLALKYSILHHHGRMEGIKWIWCLIRCLLAGMQVYQTQQQIERLERHHARQGTANGSAAGEHQHQEAEGSKQHAPHADGTWEDHTSSEV